MAQLIDARKWATGRLDAHVQRADKRRGFLWAPARFRRWRVLAEAKNELCFDRGKAPFEDGKLHDSIPRCVAHAGAEHRSDEPLLAEPLLPARPQHRDFPARHRVRPATNRLRLNRICAVQVRRVASRESRRTGVAFRRARTKRSAIAEACSCASDRAFFIAEKWHFRVANLYIGNRCHLQFSAPRSQLQSNPYEALHDSATTPGRSKSHADGSSFPGQKLSLARCSCSGR